MASSCQHYSKYQSKSFSSRRAINFVKGVILCIQDDVANVMQAKVGRSVEAIVSDKRVPRRVQRQLVLHWYNPPLISFWRWYHGSTCNDCLCLPQRLQNEAWEAAKCSWECFFSLLLSHVADLSVMAALLAIGTTLERSLEAAIYRPPCLTLVFLGVPALMQSAQSRVRHIHEAIGGFKKWRI